MAVILIVMGPQRLPEMARKLGQWSATFRRAADEFKRQIMTMDQEATPPEQQYQEPDYMDYTKDPYEESLHDTATPDAVTEKGETTAESSDPSETESPGYQDSYPSEGIPSPEESQSPEAPAEAPVKEPEKTV
jgi:sec-independent protein translocase protein TatB